MIPTPKVKDGTISKAIKLGQPFSLSYRSYGKGVCHVNFQVNVEESRRVRYWDGEAISEDGGKMEFNCVMERDLKRVVSGMLEDRV